MGWQRISRSCCRALAVMVPALLMVNCGEDKGVPDRAATAALGRDATEPVIENLLCYTDQRSAGIFDHFSNGGGEESPEAAVQAWADEHEVVVDQSGDSGAVVWVLRANRTAHTRLELRQFADGTWIVEYQDSCADRVGPDKDVLSRSSRHQDAPPGFNSRGPHPVRVRAGAGSSRPRRRASRS